MKKQLKKFIYNIKCDFKQYYELSPHPKRSIILDRILCILRSPILLVIINHRFGCLINELFEDNHLLRYFCKLFYYINRFMSVILFKTEIDEATEVGGGLFISPNGNCIIGARKIGKNCIIDKNVTIGMGIDNTSPIIGNNVIIGADSLVYGNIVIGNNVIIENNTILNKSVKDNSIVRGNPARVFRNPTLADRHGTAQEISPS